MQPSKTNFRRQDGMNRIGIQIEMWLLTVLITSGSYALSQEPETPSPLSPDEAAQTMVVPDGFRVTLFAGEPDVQQPIGFCIDDRGRLWVAEAYNYPVHGTKSGDRILILEDVDGDGRFDKRTVFYDKLNYVTGIEVGFGGVWVMSPPSMYFIPDKNGDDVPDAEPTVLLDGFGNHANSHNLANAFAWGPDGWLYGTHGRTNWSMIGKPGTPDSQRIRFDGGVWRYHPVRHVWESFADGTTNPWGIDFDDYGQGFVCNCVDPHLYHVIQGAHYEPWRNRESSRFAYERIATIADHLHFVGKSVYRDGVGTPEEDAAGGGHAHCATMIYLGDSWPDQYRNTVFMHNLHGHRINSDILHRAGSGYTASHGRDLLRAKDNWYIGVTLQYGPDGSVYSSDWSDTGECHSLVNTQRGTGRIYKISYGESRNTQIDLQQRPNLELVALQLHRNDWFVRHARRILQERAADGRDMAAATAELHRLLTTDLADDRKLRLIWALHSIGQADSDFLVGLLEDKSEYVRAWAIRLLTDDTPPTDVALQRFAELAATDPSAFVGLHLASALQRINPNDRWPLAESLAVRIDFAADQNIPLMIWYGIEPLVTVDLARFVSLAVGTETPLVRRHIARRVAELPNNSNGTSLLVMALAECKTADRQSDLLEGLLRGLEGTRSVRMPNEWPSSYSILRKSVDPAVREQALRLALIFNDTDAIQSLIDEASNPQATDLERRGAIDALVAKRVPGFDSNLLTLTRDAATRRPALRGLAHYNHPDTATTILEIYSRADEASRQGALQTLAARPAWARAMLDAIRTKHIPRKDITAFTARQIHSLGDKQLSADVDKLWGQIRETPRDRVRIISEYKRRLTPEAMSSSDRSRGRTHFAKTCGNCHRLFDAGASIGPDLTGAQRTNIDYLLLNLIDPSSSISKDFQMQIIETTDGRVVTGLVVAESQNAVTIQTPTDKIVIPLNEIEQRVASGVSMMPEGMMQRLTADEVRDLFAYLSGPDQVPELP
jgi:putative membrane-bound dehydrogenase-like protein